MKSKIFAAVAAALALGMALPAAAQDYRDGYRAPRGDYRYDQQYRGGRGDITVRTQRGEISVDRGDRLFFRLQDRPYRFRPNHTYVYTDRCNRGGCVVLEFSNWSRRPTDRFFAPLVSFERASWRNDDYDRGDWQRDNNDWRGRDTDRRDFDRRGDNRDFRDQELLGGPR